MELFTSFYLFEICNLEQKERKKKWDEKLQETVAEAVKQLDELDKVVPTNSL